MDLRVDDLSDRTLSRSEFTAGGLAGVEMVLKWGGRVKVLAVRGSLKELELDGKPNMIAHSDLTEAEYDAPDKAALTAARRRCREAFYDYWGISAGHPDRYVPAV